MHILFVTSQWPSELNPGGAAFVETEVEALRRAGVAVDIFLYEGGWSVRKYTHAIRDMHRRISANSYDLIHVRFGQCALVGRAQRQVPVVITYGGSDIEGSPAFRGFQRYRNLILMGISRLLSLTADEVIVVADHLGRKLPRRSYQVISSGVDLELFQPIDRVTARQSLDLPLNKKLILFAADPRNKRKRYSFARRACEIASRTLELDLITLNNQPHSRVPIYMSACDALILTSTNEGSPNVVKEALACNLPVVSVDVGDVRERIGKIEGCEVVNEDSPEAVAEALIRVISASPKPHLRPLVAEMDKSIWASKVIRVYEQALGRAKRH